MDGGRARLIRVPADSPFTEEPGSFIWPEDLNTRRWFSRGATRTRISYLPIDTSVILPNHYSIVTTTCSTTSSINRNIYNNWGFVVRGHVIMIRHAATNNMRVTNIRHSERHFVDFVLRWYVYTPCTHPLSNILVVVTSHATSASTHTTATNARL